MIGGYVIVDGTGISTNDGSGTNKAFYDALKVALESGKPIILTNLIENSKTISPISAFGGYLNNSYETNIVLYFGLYTLEIASTGAYFITD